MLTSTKSAASVNIEGKGWFLIGGNQYLGFSQSLKNISSVWEEGPNISISYNPHQCAVQVCSYGKTTDFHSMKFISLLFQISENVTALIGGENYPRNIYTLDWSMPE